MQFNNTSTGAVSTWAWDFGDGTTSNAQFPSHAFRPTESQLGAGNSSINFTVRLTATGPTGLTDTTTRQVTVNVLRFASLFSSGVFGTCTSCHSVGSQNTNGGLALAPVDVAFLDLTTEAAVIGCSNGQVRALPYSSAGSNLFQKVTVPCGGSPMGSGSFGTLTGTQKDAIRRWIETGALR